MARRTKREQSRKEDELLQAADEFLYDDLDSLTRGLPGQEPEEEELPPQEEEPEEELVNRAGIHMFGQRAGAAYSPVPEVPDTDWEEDEDHDTPEEALEQLRQSREAILAEEMRGKKHKEKKPRKARRERPNKPEEERKVHPLNKTLRNVLIGLITFVILLFMGFMVLAGMYPESTLLSLPENAVATAMTPVQSAFSSFTESIASYFRTLKLRANIEAEYNRLRAENEELTYIAMWAEELEYQLSQFEDMHAEITSNENLRPIACQVIGKSDGNYFSTFTINRGSRDGIEPYMAVTISGALVGYTETVTPTQATVRTIIDSEASIAGLIQSSRDQGTVRGTLGVDGKPMCRMYYLPDDHLPRPGDVVVTSGVGMSFPKGIPIGTVRESTRGMEANKQYIVVEPEVDFEHIEYVIVLRYKPAAEAVTGRDTAATYRQYVPLETERPYPTLQLGSTLNFGETPSPEPSATPTPEPTATPEPTFTPEPTPEPTIADPVFEYQVVPTGPTATPSPTPSPSPTPYITLTPEDMTYEED